MTFLKILIIKTDWLQTLLDSGPECINQYINKRTGNNSMGYLKININPYRMGFKFGMDKK